MSVIMEEEYKNGLLIKGNSQEEKGSPKMSPSRFKDVLMSRSSDQRYSYD